MKTVLFIGNSFTYVNDLPGMLAALARQAGTALEVESVVRGGWYLNRFADPADPMGQRLRQVLPTRPWDFVVLQDQSFNPAGNRQDFLDAVAALTGMLRAGAQVLLYQTWAYAEGSEKLAATGLSYGQMRDQLRAAYQAAAEACGGVRVPVGDAFSLCHARHPELPLYLEDCYYLAPAGTYLAACLFFAHITQESPLALAAPEGMSAHQAGLLRAIAAETLREQAE